LKNPRKVIKKRKKRRGSLHTLRKKSSLPKATPYQKKVRIEERHLQQTGQRNKKP
jgi:hypothetical protein